MLEQPCFSLLFYAYEEAVGETCASNLTNNLLVEV